MEPDLTNFLSEGGLPSASAQERKAFLRWLQGRPETALQPAAASSSAEAAHGSAWAAQLWQIVELQIHTSHVRVSSHPANFSTQFLNWCPARNISRWPTDRK